MKLGIFTDSHYSSSEITCSVRHNSKALDRIKIAAEHFKNEGCDCIICLGDLTDREDSHESEIENLEKIAWVLKHTHIPTTVVMGNHDGFSFSVEEFYGILGNECLPKTVRTDGNTLIFLDACYYGDGEKYRPGRDDWTDTFLPSAECDRLSDTLKSCCDRAYVFIHQSLDCDIRSDHRVLNAEAVCEIIERSGKVKSVFQGHYHPGYESVHGGVKYVTLPALCERENAYFVVEI